MDLEAGRLYWTDLDGESIAYAEIKLNEKTVVTHSVVAK